MLPHREGNRSNDCVNRLESFPSSKSDPWVLTSQAGVLPSVSLEEPDHFKGYVARMFRSIVSIVEIRPEKSFFKAKQTNLK